MIHLVYDYRKPAWKAGYWDCTTSTIGVAFHHPLAPSAFAHELAHCKLGHKGVRGLSAEHIVTQEYDAWEYCRQHGWTIDIADAQNAMRGYARNHSSVRVSAILEQVAKWSDTRPEEKRFTHSKHSRNAPETKDC